MSPFIAHRGWAVALKSSVFGVISHLAHKAREGLGQGVLELVSVGNVRELSGDEALIEEDALLLSKFGGFLGDDGHHVLEAVNAVQFRWHHHRQTVQRAACHTHRAEKPFLHVTLRPWVVGHGAFSQFVQRLLKLRFAELYLLLGGGLVPLCPEGQQEREGACAGEIKLC